MKARPRGVERRVAELLNAQLTPYGCDPVERIPVLGRTGPDLTINQLGLVVDVKSRLSIPKGILTPPGTRGLTPSGLASVPLGELTRWPALAPIPLPDLASVTKHYQHMNAWKLAEKPNGITVVILHRPGLPLSRAAFVCAQSDLEKIPHD